MTTKTRGTGRGRTAPRRRSTRQHDWVELLGVTGPFLTAPVLHQVFPDGLPVVPKETRAQVRAVVADLIADNGVNRQQAIETILRSVLDWDDSLLVGDQVPTALAEVVPEHHLTLRPDFVFSAPTSHDADEHVSLIEDDDPEGDNTEDAEDGDADVATESPYRLLGTITPWDTHPHTRTEHGGWRASAIERLAVLLRARDVPIGLTTDGRWWALVWAPRQKATGAAVFDASLFSEEPESLQAFAALLNRRRFLGVATHDRLPNLLARSSENQEDVTVTLGAQVREAVELLVRTLDRLDAESRNTLLASVDDDELYAGVVTVMMRIVFLLFAEDRRLLPSDDELYLAGYSISRLVEQLEDQASVLGEQALEHRTGAWHRILATTRALHGGVAHEDLRLPAYGGDLFDPDAHEWLEDAHQMDDRTVLRVLRAVQYVQLDGERRRLSFRALDVEQIGYVYEGLLDLEVRTAKETVLGLARPKKWPHHKEPAERTLTEIATWADEAALAQNLAKATDKSSSTAEKLLAGSLSQAQDQALSGVLPTRIDLVHRVGLLLHWHADGLPHVIPRTRRYLALSTRRAATGAHYTPRELAEDVVIGALEPLVYRPGPIETRDRSAWRLRPSAEILKLRVADVAMGSGAFLVAACRYLADILVQSRAEEGHHEALRHQRASAQNRTADAETDGVLLEARRQVAEQCLYGVDINPLAVDMAKLSLWLITMDSRRPFGFLDDRLVCGDSLLGLVSLRQLESLHLAPATGASGKPAYQQLDALVDQLGTQLRAAADARRRIVAQPVLTPRDVDTKERLLAEADLDALYARAIADRLSGVGLRVAKLPAKKQKDAFTSLAWEITGTGASIDELVTAATADLNATLPADAVPRNPLHWPIAFPEVFADSTDPGFDAIVGNPPFLGGQKLSGSLGPDYLAFLQRWDGHGVTGSADLSARFVLRIHQLLNNHGQFGLITNNTLVEGATLKVGLAQAVDSGLAIRAGKTSHKWPSKSANLEIINIWAGRRDLNARSLRLLDGEQVPNIGVDLQPVGRVAGRPFPLVENEDQAFQGSNVVGLGFSMTEAEAQALIAKDPRNAECLQPYVIGKDLNQRPDTSASRWIINFGTRDQGEAQSYPDLYGILERLIEPERAKNNRANYRDYWWRYGEYRPGLYRTIASLDHVLALSLVSNAVMPVRVPTGPVFAHACGVFALDGFADLAVLSSSAHFVWVVRYTSTLETRIRYAPSDVFLTLPRPENTPELAALGERLDSFRRDLMLSRSWGLTTTYNAVHNPGFTDPEVVELREIHRLIDHAVLAAYGWPDLDPQIGHHPTKIGTRWTVSPTARFELLDLLLEENHRRKAAEE